MRYLLIAVLTLFSLFTFSQNRKNYLFRICEEEICELGTPSGYVNSIGDTIIYFGQYYYCYTDTIKDYGIVLDTNGHYKAIDNQGNYLYDVKWFDNGPDEVSEGLFRIILNGKTGYANEKGQIVIEPQYECTTPFKNGKARVTYKCNLMDSGEHKVMTSDSWFYIDKKGTIIE